jgi:hypothetical protein
MHLVVGDTIRDRLGNAGILKQLLEKHQEPERVIEGLFITTLTRKPTAQELDDFMQLVAGNETNPEIYEDIFWGLLNSTEFLFNH